VQLIYQRILGDDRVNWFRHGSTPSAPAGLLDQQDFEFGGTIDREKAAQAVLPSLCLALAGALR
jgi:hypothetical protein